MTCIFGPDIREQTNAPRSRQPQHPDSSPCVKQAAIPCNFTYYRPLSDVLMKDYRWDRVDLGDGRMVVVMKRVRGRVAEKRRRFQVCPEFCASKPQTASVLFQDASHHVNDRFAKRSYATRMVEVCFDQSPFTGGCLSESPPGYVTH